MAKINIEVAFRQTIICLRIDVNTSVIESISLSKIQQMFPKIALNHIGIFGKKIDVANYRLQNKDRIEIYYPLNKTPNERRLARISKY